VSEDAIIQELSKCGFKTGIFKWDTDLDTVHQSVLLEMPKLSWIAINIKGSTATVEVRERLDKPDIVKAGDPCNIVALYDGQIIEMNVFQGKAAVKVSETVKKGQLLISGVLDSKTQGTRFVEAKGEVKAHLWREITKIQPLKIAKTEMTGEICTKKVLHLGDAAINLFTDSSIPFEKYGIIKKTKPIIDASPFKSYLETIEYHELKIVEESITSEKAEQLARESANAEINKLSAYEILAQNYEVKKTNDSVIVTANIEYTAAIGKSVPLDIQK
jgi:similar to stage IV sporulation protein